MFSFEKSLAMLYLIYWLKRFSICAEERQIRIQTATERLEERFPPRDWIFEKFFPILSWLLEEREKKKSNVSGITN